MDYKSAGVDIAAGEALVTAIKPMVKATRNVRVLSEIGLFGGFFDARFPDMEFPVLVASTDGIGTKLKVGILANKHNTVGECLVNHCVNDILACGARPLFFLDYFATGTLDVNIATSVIEGIARGCSKNGAALLGGETAEMPSMYAKGDYDVAGTIVGVVDKKNIINGNAIQETDVLIGLPSSGLHTNGYSLARKALFPKYDVTDVIDELQGTIAEALLAVHVSYLAAITPLLTTGLLKGLSHITGGGIVGNTSRILPEGLTLNIQWRSWNVPPIFDVIQKAGGISDEEMRPAFNLGVGMIAVVSKENVVTVLELLHQYNPFVVGTVERG